MLKVCTRFQAAVILGSLLAGSSWAGAHTIAPEAQTSSQTPPRKTSPKSSSTKKSSPAKKTPSKSAGRKAAGASTASKKGSKASSRSALRQSVPPESPPRETIHLTSAFHATEQLRPMAQQLIASRSSAAYAGVQSYARAHPGEGAAAAWLALGHAYMLDRRYNDAYTAFQQAKASGKALDDYADYLGAQAALQASRGADAYSLLDRFAERHPDSIFVANAPVLLANAYLQQNNPQGALGRASAGSGHAGRRPQRLPICARARLSAFGRHRTRRAHLPQRLRKVPAQLRGRAGPRAARCHERALECRSSAKLMPTFSSM